MSEPTFKPDPHPGVAASAISVMALVVALVIQAMGVSGQWDASLMERLRGLGLEGGLEPLIAWQAWAWICAVYFLSSWALLHVRGTWRRGVIAISTLVVHLGWIPVLALCGRVPYLVAPLVGLLWVLVGAMIYAARHREPK
ncbi:hypothetical protein HNR46_000243 [Haloferula luteola]|uniref:Uncharacterized protein n=1 Tax=Haloferula luteola TaxID=595692 RepID=A0A840UW63_9BACT|nr:hypothetical protein [Haloferula luteola]MBB5350022.1 hypothetical protein [Haloferula luteola]